MSWAEFRRLFEMKYLTSSALREKRKEFVSLKQGDLSVDEYVRRFEELSRYAPHMVATETLKVDQFADGLSPEIYRDVSIAELDKMSFAQVVNQALKAEVAQKKIREAAKEKEEEDKESREKKSKEQSTLERSSGLQMRHVAQQGQEGQFFVKNNNKKRGAKSQGQLQKSGNKKSQSGQRTQSAGVAPS